MMREAESSFGAATLVGLRLDAVVSSWHERDGARGQDPIHVWLHWQVQGWCQLHTPGSGDLGLYWQEPHDSYDMDRYGRVIVEAGGPELVVSACGRRVSAVSRLRRESPGGSVGVVLNFDGYALAAANLGDESSFTVWPDHDWQREGLRETRVEVGGSQ